MKILLKILALFVVYSACSREQPLPITSVKFTFHQIKNGESLYTLKRRYFLTDRDIANIIKTNHLKNPNILYPRQTLRIPTTTSGSLLSAINSPPTQSPSMLTQFAAIAAAYYLFRYNQKRRGAKSQHHSFVHESQRPFQSNSETQHNSRPKSEPHKGPNSRTTNPTPRPKPQHQSSPPPPAPKPGTYGYALRVLGFTTLPSQSELKASYRKLAKRYHPDISRSGTENVFKEINWAYHYLKEMKA